MADRKTTDSEVKGYGDSRIQSTVFMNRVLIYFNFATFSDDYWMAVYYDILGFLHELFSPSNSSSSIS
jgi:hypothetical protein